jgi:hypothetical protein
MAPIVRQGCLVMSAGKEESPPARAEGHYCNYFKIGYNSAEFLMDFGQLYVEEGAALMHTRIVTTPIYAKEFSRLLASSVREYEAVHGPIGLAEGELAHRDLPGDGSRTE